MSEESALTREEIVAMDQDVDRPAPGQEAPDLTAEAGAELMKVRAQEPEAKS